MRRLPGTIEVFELLRTSMFPFRLRKSLVSAGLTFSVAVYRNHKFIYADRVGDFLAAEPVGVYFLVPYFSFPAAVDIAERCAVDDRCDAYQRSPFVWRLVTIAGCGLWCA
jgi:hypothetical protein